ncbi:DNA polymerase ligase N-terminal domain-containing protein [Streptomyces sp. NBC_01477]|uniref:DNA polymerase ligase N-terminal domain-containing protein n=1 Tax=Streptomyces sp. NBC_01477 TaxID=2976015 RepID=UPI002E337034|nr:DNA polymerase ligase N-terminal domain-containing protein [Streptomyces sp. NBC_01477]
MTSKEALSRYRGKRDFSTTAEPPEGGAPGSAGRPRFVVQIHDASTMHFDFRLEVDGVLKSWAVPKGPPGDPHDKRLAVPTEDHPLAYRDFEGVIAEGGYGAGTVIIWDEGTYRSLATDRRGHEIPFAEALQKGHVSFALEGGKLRGGYALTRLPEDRTGAREAWLLVGRGHRTARRPAPDPRRARSARTGRTLRQTAAASADSGT